LVDVNCGAIPREMTEGLLFGHRRGAFTGAFDDSTGLVAQAAGGTLFLDELSSMCVEGQAKLLRVLDTGELRRLGDHVKQRVDFRVIGAVQDDVELLVERGLLRADLYHRVGSVVIHLPRLHERAQDLNPLATHFAELHGLTVTDDALALLRTHEWPGNVRELRAVVDRAAVLTDGQRILACHLAEALHGFNPTHGLAGGSLAQEREARHSLLHLCEKYEGDGEAIARAVGVSRATLYRRLKAAGIRLTAMKGRDPAPSHSSQDSPETP
jgi:two-component system NtrC family response regulator